MKVKADRLRVGVCGIGSIGYRHARLLSQRGGVDVFLADPVQEHLDAANDFPNIARSTTSFEELLDFDLDGLIVASPDQFHVSQAEAACRKGIPVLIEKPISDVTLHAEHLLSVSLETKTKVLVGYPLRHNSVFLKAKELLDQGLIGTPVSFNITLGAYETLVVAKNRFKADEKNKLFVDYSHEWDYLQWFLGKAKRVACVANMSGGREHIQAPNVVDALFEMENGISGTAHLDYIESPGRRSFTILGDKGVMTIDAVASTITTRIYNEEFVRTYKISENFDSMLLRQIEHFIIIIINGAVEAEVTIEDGLGALRVADALILSARTGEWKLVNEAVVQRAEPNGSVI